MAIKINFLANVSDVVRGGKDVEKAFDQVADSLDELATAGPDAGDKLSRGITDGAKDAGTATEKLERKFKDMADTSKRESKQTGDDIGRNVKRGTDKATDGVEEIGRESASTAKESAASFDGSAESIGQAFQEIAANAFAGFGPAGLIAGVAAAAGIGLVFASLDQGAAKTEEFKGKVAELAAELIDVGAKGAPSIEFMASQLKELATVTEDGKVKLQDLRDVAEGSKNDFKDLAQAYAGNADGLAQLVARGKERVDQLEREREAVGTINEQKGRTLAVVADEIQQQEKYNVYLGDAATKAKEAATQAENYAAAGGPEMEAKTAAIDETNAAYERAAAVQQKLVGYLGDAVPVAETAAAADLAYAKSGGPEMDRKVALIESVNTAYDNAAGAAETYVEKESGLFDTSKYIKAMQDKAQALKDYQFTLETSALTPEAKSFLDAQGVDAAATFLAGYKTATPAQQAELNRIWTEGGSTSSAAYTAALRKGIPSTVPGPTVTPRLDMAAINRDLENLRRREIKLHIKGYGTIGDTVI